MDNDVVVVAVGFNEVWYTLSLLSQGDHIVFQWCRPCRCGRVWGSSGGGERHPRSRGRGSLWFEKGASIMVESCRIATSWSSPIWENGAAGTGFVSELDRVLAASTAALAEEVFGMVH